MIAVPGFPLAGRKTTVEPMLRLRSPAFRVQYPELRNAGLIDAPTRAGMELSWHKGIFPEREIEVFRIGGAFFSEECLVFDHELQVVTNASDNYTEAEIDRALARIAALRAQDAMPSIAGPAIVAKRRGTNNYGHFLMECLPMATIGRLTRGAVRPAYLLQRVQPAVLDVILRAFRLLGVQPSSLFILDYNEPYYVEDLIVVRGLTQHGTYMSPLCAGAVARLAEGIAPGPDRRLFVRRLPGWQHGRILANQDEVAGRLASRGFRAIDPWELTLEQQIAAFRGAEEIVGVAGAAMTNIVFCQPQTRVAMLAPPRFGDTFFWFIATHRGLRYAEVRGEPAGGDGAGGGFRLAGDDIAWLAGAGAAVAAAQMLAFVQDKGELHAGLGDWIGIPGSGLAVEGFQIDGPGLDGLEYRGVLGRNWLSPWTPAGKFCGSRGLGLPLHGLSVRLTGRLAERGTCHCDAAFVDGTQVTNVAAGTPCAAGSLAPLEAFRLVLRPPPASA